MIPELELIRLSNIKMPRKESAREKQRECLRKKQANANTCIVTLEIDVV